MALLWCDDFNSYGTTNSLMTDGLYADRGFIVSDPDPNATGRCLQINPTGSGTVQVIMRKVLGTAGSTRAGAALRFWTTTLPGSSDTQYPMNFRDVDNSSLIALSLTSVGSLRVINGVGTLLGETSTPVIVPSAWNHIEMWVTFDAVAGEFEVRVNGVTVLEGTGVNTRPSGRGLASQFACLVGLPTAFVIKDFILADDSGTANNDFLGTVQVIRLNLNSDVSFNWTPSTGTVGYDLINDAPPVDATSYISAADPPPAASTFGFASLPSEVTSVRGLMTLVRARKIDGGDGNLQVSVTSDGSDANGEDRPITTAYTYWYDVFETDPATSAAWLPEAVNLADLKVNRTL